MPYNRLHIEQFYKDLTNLELLKTNTSRKSYGASRSPETQLLFQQLVQIINIYIIKAPYYWPSVKGTTADWWVNLTKGQLGHGMAYLHWKDRQAPVPPTVFPWNSKFYKNLECCSLKYAQLITTNLCRRHDNYTVVPSANSRCDP